MCIRLGTDRFVESPILPLRIELLISTDFRGTKLVVPANWEILRSEIAAIFGGVDDKRPQPANVAPEKTLILKGTIIFGGR